MTAAYTKHEIRRGNRRLLRLAKHLRTLPRDALDMENYVHECGTPACALGHYASMPRTPFYLKDDYVFSSWTDSIALYHDINDHFALDLITCEHGLLFGMTGCGNARTPLQAAKFIERFVARRERQLRGAS